ncbi:MAG: hypothetical protein NVSMB29_19570 [Candidatus Dormibacteria bacterium]
MPALRPYSSTPLRALWRILTDLLAAAWVALAVLAGMAVYKVVMSLEIIADGIARTGRLFDSVIGDFRSHVPRNVPFISDSLRNLADALQHDSGDPLIRQAAIIHERVHTLALDLGLATAAVPLLVLVMTYGRTRWAEMREMGAAAAFVRAAVRGGREQQAAAVLAYRAVATLSFRELMAASRDPVGDLDARDYSGLSRAMLRRAGLSVRALGEGPGRAAAYPAAPRVAGPALPSPRRGE